jgi:hypothetical protein
VVLKDGGVLPEAGVYMLYVRAESAHVVEEWSSVVWILPPGALEILWFNDGVGEHSEPEIAMSVNGAYAQTGFLNAVGTTGHAGSASPYPFPDHVPPPSRSLTVMTGAPITLLEPGYYPPPDGSMIARLSYASLSPPYGQIGTIPFSGTGRVMSAPPGDYLLRVYASIAGSANGYGGFHGYLVCPIHVIAAPGT